MPWFYEALGLPEAENDNSFLLSPAANRGKPTQQETDHWVRVLAAANEFGSMYKSSRSKNHGASRDRN